jgi:hypothetical protein
MQCSYEHACAVHRANNPSSTTNETLMNYSLSDVPPTTPMVMRMKYRQGSERHMVATYPQLLMDTR